MPRKTLDDDEAPRRRRGAKAVAIEAEEERGLVLRMLLHSPKDMVAGVLAAAVIIAILINALFLQAGRHPSPMFGGSVVTLPAPVAAVTNPIPRPRPAEAAARSAEPAAMEPPKPVETKPVETKPAETRAAETKPAEVKPAEAKPASDPMTNLVMKSTAAPSNVIRPPASIPTPHLSAAGRRIAAVQRTLTEYGYGQLKPTGTIGADTQAAIAKFERARKLPVTGQMSERLVHQLSAMIGHPVE